MTIWHYVAVLGAGFVAGFINTVAGGGSLLTLPLLIFVGLPPNVANGTNRLAILMQTVSAVAGFKRKKILKFTDGLQFAVPATVGAVVGAFIAVETKPKVLNYFIAGILVVVLIILLFKPKKWIEQSKKKQSRNNSFLFYLISFVVGIYAGFIHASVGFLWLAMLVLTAGYDLIKANAIKNLIILFYIPITVIIFGYHNQIDYLLGFLLGFGSMIGTKLSVWLAVKKGSPIVRYLLLIMIALSALKMMFF